ncbi:MAG: NAD(P)/FAD-dependent oxidoreductase [Christensenellales bacterium]
MKYLIIGNSIASTGVIEGIRRIDKTGEITVVGDEKRHVYSRPLISYLIQGKTDENRMKYRDDDFFKNNKVKTVLGVSAVKVDAKQKKVTLSDGNDLSYDKIAIATGSRPFLPPIEGYDKVAVKTTFFTMDDAEYLQSVIDGTKRVLIVGAGLIGLKCAECLVGKVKSITVVDNADFVLHSILDDEEAKEVEKVLSEKGVTFKLSNGVKKFEENTAVLNGESVEFDILVMAVGVRPNVSLVKDAGGKVDRGILVDDKCKTSLADVYACGDCTQYFDISSSTEKIMAILPNAYMQGETAGINMAGGEASFNKAIPMNSIGFFGYHIISAGSYDGEESIEKGEGYIKKFFVKDGLLKGFILAGDVNRAGIYTRMVRDKIPLADVDFELIKKEASLICFVKSIRDSSLTKVV